MNLSIKKTTAAILYYEEHRDRLFQKTSESQSKGLFRAYVSVMKSDKAKRFEIPYKAQINGKVLSPSEMLLQAVYHAETYNHRSKVSRGLQTRIADQLLQLKQELLKQMRTNILSIELSRQKAVVSIGLGSLDSSKSGRKRRNKASVETCSRRLVLGVVRKI